MKVKFACAVIVFILSILLTACLGLTHSVFIPLTPTPQKPTPTFQASVSSIQSATRSDTSVEVEWLKVNGIPFESTEPNSGFDDLIPLKGMINNARIVSLGEATHGTHEFFQMKHRMLEFLVEEMGFNSFAIEANWSEANLLNDYVHTGNGDPADLLKGLNFWTWDTQEVLDMIRWMRDYNENPSNTSKISFFGFDMQFDQMARNNVAEYLQQVDPQAANQIAGDYACFPQASADCQKKLQAVYDWIDQHRAIYLAKSSPKEFDRALHSARVVIQNRDYSINNNNFATRDRYMAENVTWALDQAGPNAKIVLWAHNYHVGMSGKELPQTMGDYLRKQYSNQMVVFGFLFYQGSFNAYGSTSLQTFHVDLPPTESYESYFYRAGLPYFYLDLRPVKASSPAADWLLTPHPFRSIGSGYNQNDVLLNFETAALAKKFDVAIYFQDTSPSLILEK